MELSEDNIIGFWQWFVKNESKIKDCIENENSTHKEYVVEQLNEQILSLGIFTWDVGLNDDQKWFLTISPNGNQEMYNISHEIMAVAPNHMDWLFYAGKPAKKWNRQFAVYDDEMEEQFIDASQWHYLVFVEEDGKLELVIEANNINHLDTDTADLAAEYFVTHELSERIRIQNISSIIVVPELDIEDQLSKISVLELKENLADYF